MKVKVSRHSKMGWGYTTSVANDGDGWRLEAVTKPDYTGTIKQVLKNINDDLNFQSLNGTYYNSRWFVKNNGRWVVLPNDARAQLNQLMYTLPSGKHIYKDITLDC